MSSINDRLYAGFSGLILIVASALSSIGGVAHPVVSGDMGVYGSEEFFLSFAEMIVNDPDWELVHIQILVAPLLWTLGSLAILGAVPRGGWSRWGRFGILSLAFGAVFWAVTYIFDGFVAPHTAQWVLEASTDERGAFIATFGAGQWVAIRASLLAWMFIALGTAALSVAVIGKVRSSTGVGRWSLGALVVLGLLASAWSLLLGAAGAFDPGPMVAPGYIPALIATQWLFIGYGAFLVVTSLVPSRASAPDLVSTQ